MGGSWRAIATSAEESITISAGCKLIRNRESHQVVRGSSTGKAARLRAYSSIPARSIGAGVPKFILKSTNYRFAQRDAVSLANLLRQTVSNWILDGRACGPFRRGFTAGMPSL